MNLKAMLLGTCAAFGLAGQAGAVQREFVTFGAVNSDNASPTQLFVNFNGGYEVKQIVFTAELHAVNLATRGFESLVQVFPPGAVPAFTMQPITQFLLDENGTAAQVTMVLNVPIPANQSGGQWAFRFFESVDDAGIDARWERLSISLDDGVAPPSANLGALNQFPIQITQPIGPNQVQFYQITLTEDVLLGGSKFLDIDTEGSSFPPVNDTEIGLYDSLGRLVATDDDDGSFNTSQLTFGGGIRPPVNGGQSYDGRDGTLRAGVYYLAVTLFPADFRNGGWGVNPPDTGSGTIVLNIRTNTGVIDCTADFNRDRTVNSQDFFDFLVAFFAGCA